MSSALSSFGLFCPRRVDCLWNRLTSSVRCFHLRGSRESLAHAVAPRRPQLYRSHFCCSSQANYCGELGKYSSSAEGDPRLWPVVNLSPAPLQHDEDAEAYAAPKIRNNAEHKEETEMRDL